MDEGNWIEIQNTQHGIKFTPENVVLETKIDDGHGVRNITTLKRQGRLWFTPDGKMYVYYTPTHWRATHA